MKHLCTFIIICCLATVCHGQEMTLQECIRKGIDNNLSVANARIGINKGLTGISQSRARLLPTINGLIQMTDYLKSPVNVTTGTLLGNDFPTSPTWQTIKSMQYNVSAGFQLTVPLYDQTIFATVDVAKTVKEIYSISYDKAVEDLTVQISKVYYLAQASLEQVRLSNENIIRMVELCSITEALLEQGVVMEVDLNRVRINLENLKALHDQNFTLYEQQLNLLRFLMNTAPDSPLRVTRMSENIKPQTTASVNTGLPELLLAAQQKTLAERRIKNVKAGYLPTLSLTAYAGGLGYQEKFDRFFHTSAATDNWFGNCYVSLSARIPLFDANAKKLQVRQHRYEAQQADNNMKLLQKQLTENYANASLQFDHNLQQYRTQAENRQQAEDVYKVTEEQYKEGVASMTALLHDEMQLRTAQTACIQALCQCHLAQLELLRLSGTLSQISR